MRPRIEDRGRDLTTAFAPEGPPDSNNSNNINYNNKNKIIIGGSVLFLIGFLNGSLTSGTGLFVTIWLVKWFGLSYTSGVAYTLILVGIGWNGAGAIIIGLSNDIKWSWLPALISGSIIGGYLGAHFALLKGEILVKKAFKFLAFFMGTSLLVRGTFL